MLEWGQLEPENNNKEEDSQWEIARPVPVRTNVTLLMLR